MRKVSCCEYFLALWRNVFLLEYSLCSLAIAIHTHIHNARLTNTHTDIQVSFKPNDFVVEDGDVMVVCNVMGGGSITEFSWLHNGSTVSGVNIENDFGARTSILRLFLLRFLDAGSYMCRATVDNVVHSSSSGMLQIASKLSIVAETTQEAFEGDDAVLVCNVTSFPAPTLRWYRGSSSNPPPLATQMVNDDDFGLLKLTGVSREMAGTYTCHGNYAFGSNEVDIDFVVLSKSELGSTSYIVLSIVSCVAVLQVALHKYKHAYILVAQ